MFSAINWSNHADNKTMKKKLFILGLFLLAMTIVYLFRKVVGEIIIPILGIIVWFGWFLLPLFFVVVPLAVRQYRKEMLNADIKEQQRLDWKNNITNRQELKKNNNEFVKIVRDFFVGFFIWTIIGTIFYNISIFESLYNFLLPKPTVNNTTPTPKLNISDLVGKYHVVGVKDGDSKPFFDTSYSNKYKLEFYSNRTFKFITPAKNDYEYAGTWYDFTYEESHYQHGNGVIRLSYPNGYKQFSIYKILDICEIKYHNCADNKDIWFEKDWDH